MRLSQHNCCPLVRKSEFVKDVFTVFAVHCSVQSRVLITINDVQEKTLQQ